MLNIFTEPSQTLSPILHFAPLCKLAYIGILLRAMFACTKQASLQRFVPNYVRPYWKRCMKTDGRDQNLTDLD